MANEIKPFSVGKLKEHTFFIPNYQRGYRWTRQEVYDLLTDISEFEPKDSKNDYYCLQPLVVKKREGSEFEVIDGQQRLTTIQVLLSALPKENQPTYSISYETREDSAKFLNTFDESLKDKNIDYWHIMEAKQEVEKFFEKEGHDKDKFLNKLLQSVKFIWYETDEEDPIKVFTRLNIWKIPLTNGELIKALFLQRSNFSGEGATRTSQLIADEWNNMQQALQDDQLWFLFHKRNDDPTTRIDFLFDLMFELTDLGPDTNCGKGKDKTFRYFYNAIKENKEGLEGIAEMWAKVRNIFLTLMEFYNDLHFYHYVGYLVESEYNTMNTMKELLKKWRDKGGNKKPFLDFLKKKVKEHVENPPLDQQYKNDGSDKGGAKPILLFHNIQTVINQNTTAESERKDELQSFSRFPFHIYKKESWDVEHIDSNTTNSEDDPATQKEWLLNVYMLVNEDLRKEIRQAVAEGADDKTLQKCYEKIKPMFPEESWTDEEKNQIGNYVLLDSSTNRSYGNSIFSAKRRILIGRERGEMLGLPTLDDEGNISQSRDKAGSPTFVLPCTRNVFLKCYSPVLGNPNYWLKTDARFYRKDIENCIKKLKNNLKGQNYEQDR